MQLKNLAVLLFSATALATAEKRDEMQDAIDSAMEDMPAGMPTKLNDMPQPDPSIIKVIQTAVPKSLLMNSEKAEEAASSIADGNPPDWYNGLPDDVKDYYSELGDWFKDNADEITGNLPSPTGDSGSGSSGSDDSSSEDSSETDSAETQSSTGGAPAPTGAVAASVAGAVGILGLAVAL